jgi:hypothetical protein
VHWIRGWGLERLLAADERAQALVLFAAGGAAVEVRAQPGHRGVRVLAGELELDVPVASAAIRWAAAIVWRFFASDAVYD